MIARRTGRGPIGACGFRRRRPPCVRPGLAVARARCGALRTRGSCDRRTLCGPRPAGIRRTRSGRIRPRGRRRRGTSCASRRINPGRPRSGRVRPCGSGRRRPFCAWRRGLSGRARPGPRRAHGFCRGRATGARGRVTPGRPRSRRVRARGLARRAGVRAARGGGRCRAPLGNDRRTNAFGAGQEARTHPRLLRAPGRRRGVGRGRCPARLYTEGLARCAAGAGIGGLRRSLACVMGGWAGGSGIVRTFHCDPRMGKVGRGPAKALPRDRMNAYLASDSSSGAATNVLQPYLPRACGRDLSGST